MGPLTYYNCYRNTVPNTSLPLYEVQGTLYGVPTAYSVNTDLGTYLGTEELGRCTQAGAWFTLRQYDVRRATCGHHASRKELYCPKPRRHCPSVQLGTCTVLQLALRHLVPRVSVMPLCETDSSKLPQSLRGASGQDTYETLPGNVLSHALMYGTGTV